MKRIIKLQLAIILFFGLFSSCKTDVSKAVQAEIISMNTTGKGPLIEVQFRKGERHSHPLFAIWIENQNGKYIQTLYVSKSIGKGVFEYGNNTSGRWMPGPLRRPAALPYWAHKRNVKEADGLLVPTMSNPIADVYTGATPRNDFDMFVRTDQPIDGSFRVFMEINQSFDWNNYWYNDRFVNDQDYRTSAQPAIVYATDLIDPQVLQDVYTLNAIGHSHYNGSSGELFTDLGTLTTALKIASSITVRIRKS